MAVLKEIKYSNEGTLRRDIILSLVIGVSSGFAFGYILLSNTGICWDLAGTPYRDSPFKAGQKLVSVADELEKVRVFCIINTYPENHELRARHVKATWGKRCTKILFMSTKADPYLPSIKLPVKDGYDYLWNKTILIMQYIYENYGDEADWFLKADDDTYVIMENLRYMLSGYNSNAKIYFGCRFKPFTRQGYMSGGAGVVFSYAALKHLVVNGLIKTDPCRASNNSAEDAELGVCLDTIGVKAMDTRDLLKRGRFMPFEPHIHLVEKEEKEKDEKKEKDYWYRRYVFYPTKEGRNCCSDYAISFHYVSPGDMYAFEYLLYTLKTYAGQYNGHSTLQAKTTS